MNNLDKTKLVFDLLAPSLQAIIMRKITFDDLDPYLQYLLTKKIDWDDLDPSVQAFIMRKISLYDLSTDLQIMILSNSSQFVLNLLQQSSEGQLVKLDKINRNLYADDNFHMLRIAESKSELESMINDFKNDDFIKTQSKNIDSSILVYDIDAKNTKRLNIFDNYLQGQNKSLFNKSKASPYNSELERILMPSLDTSAYNKNLNKIAINSSINNLINNWKITYRNNSTYTHAIFPFKNEFDNYDISMIFTDIYLNTISASYGFIISSMKDANGELHTISLNIFKKIIPGLNDHTLSLIYDYDKPTQTVIALPNTDIPERQSIYSDSNYISNSVMMGVSSIYSKIVRNGKYLDIQVSDPTKSNIGGTEDYYYPKITDASSIIQTNVIPNFKYTISYHLPDSNPGYSSEMWKNMVYMMENPTLIGILSTAAILRFNIGFNNDYMHTSPIIFALYEDAIYTRPDYLWYDNSRPSGDKWTQNLNWEKITGSAFEYMANWRSWLYDPSSKKLFWYKYPGVYYRVKRGTST